MINKQNHHSHFLLKLNNIKDLKISSNSQDTVRRNNKKYSLIILIK